MTNIMILNSFRVKHTHQHKYSIQGELNSATASEPQFSTFDVRNDETTCSDWIDWQFFYLQQIPKWYDRIVPRGPGP